MRSSIPYLLLAIQLAFSAGPSLDLPNFPQDYQVLVEIDDLVARTTIRRAEYYDSVRNRGRYDSLDEEKTVFLVLDYSKGQQYEIYDSSICRSKPLQTSDDPRSASSLENMSVQSFLQYGNTFPARYMGKSTVRGIECDYWSRTIDLTEGNTLSSYTVDYYFSTEDWRMTESLTPVYRSPVRASINGTRKQEELTKYVSLSLEFFQFQAEIPSPLFFEAPNLFKCVTMPQKDFPELPSAFQTLIERTNTQSNFTEYIEEWKDIEKNKIRFDISTTQVSFTQIYRTDNQVLYRIANGSKCIIEALSSTVPEDLKILALLPGNPDHLLSEAFLGEKTVRGISCSSWTRTVVQEGRANRTQTLIYYFSNQWKIAGSMNHSSVPVRIEIFQEDNKSTTQPNWIIEFIKFIPRSIDERTFLMPCISTPATTVIRTAGYSAGALAALGFFCSLIGFAFGGFVVGYILYRRMERHNAAMRQANSVELPQTTTVVAG